MESLVALVLGLYENNIYTFEAYNISVVSMKVEARYG